eukprot:4959045-Pleurochrysis_carterae.AAC.1
MSSHASALEGVPTPTHHPPGRHCHCQAEPWRGGRGCWLSGALRRVRAPRARRFWGVVEVATTRPLTRARQCSPC